MIVFTASGVVLQFLEIPALKLVPLIRIVAEPFSQFLAGSKLIQPDVNLGLLF
jgi:hypothetical protein